MLWGPTEFREGSVSAASRRGDPSFKAQQAPGRTDDDHFHQTLLKPGRRRDPRMWSPRDPAARRREVRYLLSTVPWYRHMKVGGHPGKNLPNSLSKALELAFRLQSCQHPELRSSKARVRRAALESRLTTTKASKVRNVV